MFSLGEFSKVPDLVSNTVYVYSEALSCPRDEIIAP